MKKSLSVFTDEGSESKTREMNATSITEYIVIQFRKQNWDRLQRAMHASPVSRSGDVKVGSRKKR